MASLLALTDRLPRLLPERARRALETGERLRGELLDALGEHGALLYPVYTTTAPRHGAPVLDAVRLHMPFAHQGIFNVLGFPATAVPLGLDRRGLPLGVQVVSRPGNDHVTIAIAIALERAFGGWTPPALVPAATRPAA
jgi:fatty acid amide hydrolase 2